MKKITILVLLFLLTLTLTSCVNEKQEQFAVYSFYGKNENFIISNGTIVLANSEDIFWGGNLQAAQSESISDISSYKATFYTMVDGKQEIIHVDEVQNLSNSYFDITLVIVLLIYPIISCDTLSLYLSMSNLVISIYT